MNAAITSERHIVCEIPNRGFLSGAEIDMSNFQRWCGSYIFLQAREAARDTGTDDFNGSCLLPPPFVSPAPNEKVPSLD